MPAGSILVADDDAAIRTVLNQALSRAGYEVRSTSNAATLWRWVSQGEGDLVITDVVMPDENAFELLPRIKKMRPELPVIVMSAQNTFMTAVRASERGAYEYLPKPFDLKELIGIVGRALSEPKQRTRPAPKQDDFDSIPLVGRSPAMQEIYRVLARLMQTDLTVMISGESGTGKELVARALHDYGKRRSGPFVAINMAAIPRDLIESELFGHEKGAFTGANTRSSGRFEQAEGGTLFLDEIGDMPMEAQTRLLRVLQQGEYTTVGGRTPIKADVRIIAASNKDLRILIQQGLFREDLFFRLNVVPLRLPPLRERLEDVPDLIRHFGRARGPAGQAARPGRTRAAQAPPLARQRARAREPRPPAGRALSAGDDRGGGDRRRALPAGDGLGRRRAARGGGALGRGRAAPRDLFRGLRRRDAAARPLSPGAARDRASAPLGDARGDPRQPDPRRRPARAQPQHLAQEDPRPRHPGVPQQRVGRPRHLILVATVARMERSDIRDFRGHTSPPHFAALNAGYGAAMRLEARGRPGPGRPHPPACAGAGLETRARRSELAARGGEARSSG